MKFLCLLGMMVAARDSLLHHWRWYEEEMQKPDTVRRVPSPSIMKLYHLLIFTFVLNRCPTTTFQVRVLHVYARPPLWST